jgi:hypothetical protein
VKDENGDLSDIRQIKLRKTQILISDPSTPEIEIVIAESKKYKSLVSDQIPAELIQAGGEILLSAIHKLINSI